MADTFSVEYGIVGDENEIETICDQEAMDKGSQHNHRAETYGRETRFDAGVRELRELIEQKINGLMSPCHKIVLFVFVERVDGSFPTIASS